MVAGTDWNYDKGVEDLGLSWSRSHKYNFLRSYNYFFKSNYVLQFKIAFYTYNFLFPKYEKGYDSL